MNSTLFRNIYLLPLYFPFIAIIILFGNSLSYFK